MYSGTTFRKGSGSIVGVHQKIDRIARRHLKRYLNDETTFPVIKDILHFEGNNGPDGIKRKSPSRDEPWHFIDPKKPNDRVLLDLIQDHVVNLSVALRDHNDERAAFEAAWLAHAVVDGLTPAHHYPLNDKIEELWGKPHHERDSVKDKWLIKGKNRRDTVSKNWQYMGVGGIFTAHLGFEMGVASSIAPRSFKVAGPSADDIKEVQSKGFERVFLQSVHVIDSMKLYDEFGEHGWTRQLANKTVSLLVPEIIKTVCLAWCYALYLSQEKNNEI